MSIAAALEDDIEPCFCREPSDSNYDVFNGISKSIITILDYNTV